MSLTQTKPSLQSRILKTDLSRWRGFQFIQQDDFKNLPQEAHERLKASILTNNFTQPFYVWEDPETGAQFCLDGKHRSIILEELLAEGYDIPDLLPATFVYCKDRAEAAKLVLIYSSMYAKITQQGLFDFVQLYELDYFDLKEQIDIPDLSLDRFEQKFDVFHIKNDLEEYLMEAEIDILVRAGDLFQLGDHRVICGSFREPEVQSSLLIGDKARMVITDPPYNLPADFFTNISGRKHEDFAMAAGEMNDDEFVSFLQAIMHASTVHTLPGAIHYIFMDWRHMWHMTEAARKVYGSMIPKQLVVWSKDVMALGSFYRSQHELCFIFKNGEKEKHVTHLDLIDRIRTNVWNYPGINSTKSPDREELANHSTPKNSTMIADAILDTTNPGDGVVDWFLGSGTTLIAAEKTGRKCYGAEIEPKFIQSTIKRYIQYCRKNGRDVIFKHENGNLQLKDFTDEQIIN